MPQRIQLHRSTNVTAPASLLAGEPALAIAAGNVSKLWVGDGTAVRMLLSTVPADNPQMTAAYLEKAGGAISGAITWTGTPTANTDLTTKTYVDTALMSLEFFMGDWTVNATTNNPNLGTLAAGGTMRSGQYWVVKTDNPNVPFVIPATAPFTPAIPGLPPGTQVHSGDSIIWSTASSSFSHIAGGGMTQQDGDARYLQLTAGGTVAGVVLLSATLTGASNDAQAATKKYVDDIVGAIVHSVSTDTTLTGNGTSATPLSISAKTDTSMTGNGTVATPLSVAVVDGGTW